MNAQFQKWLKELGPDVWQAAKRSLPYVGDDIIDAINTFKNTSGFDKVVKDYLVRGFAWKEGARFVMRYAVDNLKNSKALFLKCHQCVDLGVK